MCVCVYIHIWDQVIFCESGKDSVAGRATGYIHILTYNFMYVYIYYHVHVHIDIHVLFCVYVHVYMSIYIYLCKNIWDQVTFCESGKGSVGGRVTGYIHIHT